MQQASASVDSQQLDHWLAAAKSGDDDAFAAILRARQGMVFAIARNFLRNGAHAEDIAQDVFLELHRNLNGIESGAHLVSWLRQVTGRKCIDQSRRVWFKRWIGLEDSPPSAVETPAPTVGASEDPFLESRIQNAMGKLPERTRLMMVLRFQEEMEPGEIAEAMQVPVGTVKSSIHRGLEQMRRRLAAVTAAAANKSQGRKSWISLKTI